MARRSAHATVSAAAAHLGAPLLHGRNPAVWRSARWGRAPKDACLGPCNSGLPINCTLLQGEACSEERPMLGDCEMLCCGPDRPNRDGHISRVGRRLVSRAARAGAASTAAVLLLLAPTMDSPGRSTLELTTEPPPRPPPLTAPVAMLVSYRLAATRCHPKQTTSCYHHDFLLPTPVRPHR
jgi:hypothetical protein